MKNPVLKLLLIGMVSLSMSSVFAAPAQSKYQNTYWHIVNNTGKTLYVSNPGLDGAWQKNMPFGKKAMPIPTGTYSNVLSSINNASQANVIVCTNPTMYGGNAYCSVASNFCTLSTLLIGKYTPHYRVHVNAEVGTLSCVASKAVTPDGMTATFVVNNSVSPSKR